MEKYKNIIVKKKNWIYNSMIYGVLKCSGCKVIYLHLFVFLNSLIQIYYF